MLKDPADELRAAAARLVQAAEAMDKEVTEETPDCCEESHNEPGLYHYGGCCKWLTVWRDHAGPGGACRCWDSALAVARTINQEGGPLP